MIYWVQNEVKYILFSENICLLKISLVAFVSFPPYCCPGGVEPQNMRREPEVNWILGKLRCWKRFIIAELHGLTENPPPFQFLFKHTWYLSRTPRVYSCKFFLAGVNFYRFNAKNWQFTVYFAVITQKNGNLLCILP